MQKLAITWLGHSAFRVRTPGGVEILFDPWYTGNPKFPERARPAKADLILVSHGHSDHITDAAAVARQTGATVVGIFEVVSWLGSKGVQAIEPMNKGGSITVKGLRVTMTEAIHSSSFDENGIEGIPGAPFEYLVFVPVPEGKTVKNRIHWDVDVSDVRLLVEHGATVLREPDDDIRWTIMADPEGNEFCAFVD